MITKFFLSFLAGLVTHQSKPLIDRHISGITWNFFFRVMIGDIAKLPGTIALFLDFTEKSIPASNGNERKTWEIVERLTVAYILSSGTFFIGVLLGYLIDAIKGERE